MPRSTKPRSKPDPLITTGQDKYGAFEVRDNHKTGEPELCITGDHIPKLMLVYLNAYPILPKDIEVAKTILKRPDGAIGIDCGCYARFHRQVAHITDRMKAQNA